MCSFLLYLSGALLLLPLCTAKSSGSSNTVDFHVGVILDFDSVDSPVGRIGMSCLSMAHSDFYSIHGNYKTRLVLHVRDSNDSVVDAAAVVSLDLLQDVKVDAIIGPQNLHRAHVPIISFSATSPSLIPRTPYFVQTAQSDANQVQAIASIVEAFQWNQVVIIYEDTEFGNGIIPYLSNALQDVNARVSYRSVLPRSATDDFISKELYKMMTMQTRVFVVHMSQSLGTRLFLKVRELGMMRDGYVWIVTSGLTDLFNLVSFDVVEAMQGVLGVRPLITKSKELQSFDMKPAETSIFGLWAYDTLWALAMAAERVGNNGSNVMNNEADVESVSPFAMEISETGPKLLEALLETRFTGLSESLTFNERQVGTWTPSGGISKEVNLNVTSSYSTSKENFRSIIWPGDSTKAPRGWEVPVSDPQTNDTKVSGYYKEVFDAVMAALPYAVPYEYSPYPFFNPDGSRAGSYDDLVYQVSLQVNCINKDISFVL
ncbi:hypothetical protein Pfo_005829 [Paulownia fortunei]|nr:hypothetical protein Pfo_005829 [Paulownia fortunei]